MGDDAGDVGGGQAGAAQGLLGGVGHRPGGHLEHFDAVHLEVVEPLVHALMGGRGERPAAGDFEQVGLGAVGAEVGGEDAAGGHGAEDGGPRPVAEEDAGGAVGPVHDLREDFGADDQHMPGGAAGDEAGAAEGGVDEAGAGGRAWPG